MYGLAKLAMPSFEARRNKQYWQLLKRLHGGSEETVYAIKQTGDVGIYHGTRSELLPKIEEGGLKVGPFREFGKGTFFGDKATADLYGAPQVRTSSGFKAGNVIDKNTGKSITDEAEMVEYLRKYPDPEYDISGGSYVRLAKPSELGGTKILFPPVQKAKVFDLSGDKTLDQVAPSQTVPLADRDKSIKRLKSAVLTRAQSGTEEEQRQVIENMLRTYYSRQPDWVLKKYTPETLEQEIKNEIMEYMKLRSEPKEFQRALKSLGRDVGEDLAEKMIVPRNDFELHQMQTYGKVRGTRLFERLDPTNFRKELFFDKTNVPPELLRHQDGRMFEKRVTPPVETKEERMKAYMAKLEQQAKERQQQKLNDENAQGIATLQQRIQSGGGPKGLIQEQPDPNSNLALFAGLGAGTISAGGGMAYLAHKKKKEGEK